MPSSGMLWRHVIINTRGSWLHGDPRGFRSRGHRIHSSGDYKHPPPEGEHQGLYRYRIRQAWPEVFIPQALRGTIGGALISYLVDQQVRVLVAAVANVHTHLLVELPADLGQVKKIIGQAKRRSSRAVKKVLPGSIWSAGGTFELVRTRSHLLRVYRYILFQQGAEAWTWSFKDGTLDGQYARAGPALRSGPA